MIGSSVLRIHDFDDFTVEVIPAPSKAVPRTANAPRVEVTGEAFEIRAGGDLLSHGLRLQYHRR